MNDPIDKIKTLISSRSTKRIPRKFIIAAAVTASVLFIVLINSSESNDYVTSLERPEFNENESVWYLDMEADGVSKPVEVTVSPKQLTPEETEKLFENAYQRLLEVIMGDNESFDRISRDLNFVDRFDDLAVSMTYSTDNYSVIDSYGGLSVDNVEKAGETHTVFVEMKYKEEVRYYEILLTVFPPDYTQEELFERDVREAISRADEQLGSELILPEKVRDKEITYVIPTESKTGIIFLIIIFAGVYFYYKKYIVPRNEEEKREKQLKQDYADVVSKLTLLINAGMSEAAAFNKIAYDYAKKKENNPKLKRYAYEEIATTANRISTGTYEPEAYAMFGRSCRIHSYIKLGNILSQNIRKGAKDFTLILRSEVTEAFQERKMLAKKTGEEAGIRLLIPMIIQLMIVMVVIMVPAFMSF